MIRFPRKSTPQGKLSGNVQAKLARAALRAAHTAAGNGQCALAEGLFVAGNMRLQAAGLRARTKGAVFKTLDVSIAGADAGKAIVECWERERAAQVPPGGTT